MLNRREKPAWEQMLIMAEMYSPEMAANVIYELKRRGLNVPEPVMTLLERKAKGAAPAVSDPAQNTNSVKEK